MTDDEREAELRHGGASGLPRGGDVAFLLRLLDEARAEIARLHERAICIGIETIERLRAGEAFEVNGVMLLGASNLRAPPEADVMEQRARDIDDIHELEALVCALEEKLHAARQHALQVEDKFLKNELRHAETAIREARAAAIEEAAQIAEQWKSPRMGIVVARQPSHAIEKIVQDIRALADTPPQSKSPNPFHHCDDCSDRDCYAFGCKKYGRTDTPPQPEGGER